MKVSDKSDMSDRSDKKREPMTEQDAKLTLIEMGLQAFREQFLPDEAFACLDALWETAQQSKALSLNVTKNSAGNARKNARLSRICLIWETDKWETTNA